MTVMFANAAAAGDLRLIRCRFGGMHTMLDAVEALGAIAVGAARSAIDNRPRLKRKGVKPCDECRQRT